jgi:hypothetical protein
LVAIFSILLLFTVSLSSFPCHCRSLNTTRNNRDTDSKFFPRVVECVGWLAKLWRCPEYAMRGVTVVEVLHGCQ